MNNTAIIKALRVEADKLDQAITQLQSLASPNGLISAAKSPKRRGRKSMGAEERHQVSERMKRYWAQRSKQKKGRVATKMMLILGGTCISPASDLPG